MENDLGVNVGVIVLLQGGCTFACRRIFSRNRVPENKKKNFDMLGRQGCGIMKGTYLEQKDLRKNQSSSESS